MRRSIVIGAALSFVVATAAPAAHATDFAQTALNIVPSGQPGAIPAPAGANTQGQMYDALTPLRGNVTQADLLADFKSEASAPTTPARAPPRRSPAPA